ncbi:hypothetical protein Mapa_014749 [Marchantia paleacea]|nr:hypothetical protein Mapa_014749 [Marchantia paleacea]
MSRTRRGRGRRAWTDRCTRRRFDSRALPHASRLGTVAHQQHADSPCADAAADGDGARSQQRVPSCCREAKKGHDHVSGALRGGKISLRNGMDWDEMEGEGKGKVGTEEVTVGEVKSSRVRPSDSRARIATVSLMLQTVGESPSSSAATCASTASLAC